MNMLPKQFSAEPVAKADRKLSEISGRNVFILFCNEDFALARENAGKVYERLLNSSNFESLSLYQDVSIMEEVEDFVFGNRFNLIPENESDVEELSEKALAGIYSPFTFSSLSHIDMDPYLLTELEMKNIIESLTSGGTELSVRDNVLARNYDGKWYVLLRVKLSREGAALARSDNGVAEIYSVCNGLEGNGQRFICSGTPVHSYKSSTSASREIKVISAVSMAVVIVLLLLVFKSPVPVFLSFASIVVSAATAFLLTVSVFHKIHVLALVFGTTLIGSCIDYSLHFFISWKANASLKSGREIREYLFSGSVLSLVSTEICFGVLVFSPFELLRQMAVFSLSGIFSSFLTVVCVFPLVPVPPAEKRSVRGVRLAYVPSWYDRKTAGRIAVTIMFAFAFVCLYRGYDFCRIENNVSKLYRMEGRVLSDQLESSRVLGYAPRGWFVLRGDSEESLLELESDFVSCLRNEAGDVKVLCSSDIVPSLSRQVRSKEIYSSLMASVEDQLALVESDGSFGKMIAEEWHDRKNEFVGMKDVPPSLMTLCENSWLGNIGGEWFSVIMPSRLSEGFDGNEFALRFGGNVFFVNKAADISRDMDVLTAIILKSFSVAFILIFIVLKFFYSLKQSLKIISVPLLIVLMVSSVFSIAKIHLEFFSITGMILVFGLGLDYVIYMAEAQKRKDSSENKSLEPFAILLSFVTTAVSFGAIAMSSFIPVHLMGIAIVAGLVTAYLASFFYERD